MIKLWKLQDAPPHIKQLAPESSECIWVFEVPKVLMPEVEELFSGGGADRIKELSKHVSDEGSVIVFVRNGRTIGDVAELHSSLWSADA